MKDIFIIFNGLSVPRSWLRSGSGSMTYDTRMTYENVKRAFFRWMLGEVVDLSLDSHELTLL